MLQVNPLDFFFIFRVMMISNPVKNTNKKKRKNTKQKNPTAKAIKN